MLLKKNVCLLAAMLGITSSSMAASLCKGYQSELFGDKVCVFDEAQSKGDIQAVVNEIHNYEMHNEFGSDGYALLFQPGTYPHTRVPVGFYTQVSGLGLTPDATTIQKVKVDAEDMQNNTSLTTFWRGAENFAVEKDLVWAVSQAAPLRNVHVPGVLVLALGGEHYASGGFLANSQVDGGIASSGQQQWITRNTSMGNWYDHGVWNMVFVGSKHTPNPEYPNAVVDKTPKIQEKPFLAFNKESKKFQVIVPDANASNSQGSQWDINHQVIPESQFVVVKPGMSSAAINAALKKQKGGPLALIFTPGQYSLDSTIEINQDHTVVLGLGVPVLTAVKPHTAILSTAATGVKISGILLEAGSNDMLQEQDPSLLQIGEPGHDLGDVNSPTVLSDIYCRVGGRIPAQTNSCITINDSHVLADNLWLWRADHGAGAPNWNSNQANYGLLVNGEDVTIYGLAVEHFEKNQVIWSGENGAVYFYQSELPYDVPKDFEVAASFKIADKVRQFTGYGFGIYDFFRGSSVGAYALSAIEAPDHAGVQFHRMVSVKLGTSYGPKHIVSMIKTMPEGALIGPSSAAGISPFEFWKGKN